MVVSNKKKAIIVWLLALLVLFSAAGATWFVLKADDPSSESLNQSALQGEFNAAIAQSMEGKCQEAVIAFEALLKKTVDFPEIDAESKLRAGQCYMTLKRYQDASNKFEAASKQYETIGDSIKQAQAQSLFQRAAAENLNNTESQPVKRTEPTPSVPPQW